MNKFALKVSDDGMKKFRIEAALQFVQHQHAGNARRHGN